MYSTVYIVRYIIRLKLKKLNLFKQAMPRARTVSVIGHNVLSYRYTAILYCTSCRSNYVKYLRQN